MKNILFIVIDSVTNDVLFNKENSSEIAPFLNTLRKKSISGDKMFSEAPYTEAALMSLLGSIDTLDYGGYLERLKNCSCVFEDFKNNDFNVFYPNYYPSIYPSYVAPGPNEIRYIEGFNFNHIWEYRFSYYADLYLSGKTSKKENNMLEEMLDDNFKSWIKYLEKLRDNDLETSMLNDNVNKSNIDNDLISLNKEYNLFLKDKVTYLKELFTLKEGHRLFKIDNYQMIDKIHDDNIRKNVISRYRDTFKRIAKLDFKKNLLNNKYPYRKTFKALFKGKFDIVKGLMAGYKNSLIDKDLYERINNHYDLFKIQRSFYTVSQEFFKWLDNNKNSKWISYIHVDDAHFPEQIFTYDTKDINVVDGDFKRINQYLDKIPKEYKGSITYDLSLNYCDHIIKNIFDYLEKYKLLDNTSVVITADHGFSYYFSPVREKYVISNYRENYNVPFIIYNKDIKPRMIEGYLQTKDIPATLLALGNISQDTKYKGNNLLNYQGGDYSLLEYMGGGCPDVKRRPIILGVRDDNYSVNIKISINNDFKDYSLEEVYDLKKDPFEHNNLNNKKRIKDKINKEMSILEKRFNEIKKQY